jgi:hypothetical protein
MQISSQKNACRQRIIKIPARSWTKTNNPVFSLSVHRSNYVISCRQLHSAVASILGVWGRDLQILKWVRLGLRRERDGSGKVRPQVSKQIDATDTQRRFVWACFSRYVCFDPTGIF